MFKKKAIIFYGRMILSLAVILYLATILDWGRIKKILPLLNFGLIGMAYFFVLLSILTSSIRWSTLLKHFKMTQGVLISLRFYLISMFFGLMLPGVIGGDVVRLGLGIGRHGIDMKDRMAASVFLERTCGFVAILTIFMLMVLVAPSILIKDVFNTSAYILPLVIIVSLTSIFAFLKAAPAKWLASNEMNGWVIGRISGLFRGLRDLSVPLVLWTVFLSAGANLLDICASYFLAEALGIDISFYLFLIIIPMIYVLTALPISLGGLGVREGILTFFLVRVGVVASDAVLLAFLIYLNRLAVASIGGILQLKSDKPDILKSHQEIA